MEKREAGRLLCDFLAGRTIAEARLEKLSTADWVSLASLALRLNVRELFYREIKSRNFPTELIPLNFRNRLRATYRNLATGNTSLFFNASKILEALAKNQLPVIALKGLALAKNIYGDIALRPMSDIDLLLKKEDLTKAGRILLTLGYKQDIPAWESMLKIHHHLPPFTSEGGAAIELHWNIVPPDNPSKVDLDGLWARACYIKINNVAVRIFSPEDLFLHLCIHACVHLQTGLGLIPLCDMAGLIKKSADKIDWQIVIARAKCWGVQKCVYLMLLLVRELLGAAPPERIMLEIKPGDYQPAFFNEALEQIFEADISPTGQIIVARIDQLAKIKKAKGLKGKILAFLKRAFPSRENLARSYPLSVSSPKIYLCYLFRLGRLIAYFTKILLRLFHHDQSVVKVIRHEQQLSTVSDWLFS